MSERHQSDVRLPAGADPLRVGWIAGPETFEQYSPMLQPLAAGLVGEAVDVVVFSPPSAPPEPLGPLPNEVVGYADRHWWGCGRGSIESLAGEFRKRKLDLVHGLDGTVAKLTEASASAAGLQYVLGSYALADAHRLAEPAKHAAGLLAASEPIGQALTAGTDAPDERLHLLRPGVSRAAQPACFAQADRTVAIVAGGSLTEFDAFDAVLACFAELVARKYDCVFFLVSCGRGEHRMRKRVEQLELQHQLTFAECRPMGQLTEILKGADVYISPTRQERIDVRSLLAMAAGVPVLAADGVGANDFLLDGRTAMSYTLGDSSELTVKLAALLDDHAGARSLAESALEYVGEHHDPAAAVRSLAELYRRVLAAEQRQEGNPASGASRTYRH